MGKLLQAGGARGGWQARGFGGDQEGEVRVLTAGVGCVPPTFSTHGSVSEVLTYWSSSSVPPSSSSHSRLLTRQLPTY